MCARRVDSHRPGSTRRIGASLKPPFRGERTAGMEIFRDLRFAFRSLRKSPGLMFVATLALSFGIGLTATMWSIIYGALIKGLPYDNADRIVAVAYTNTTQRVGNRRSIPIVDLEALKASTTSFERLATYTCGTINISGSDKADRYDGCWMGAGALDIPHVTPVLGRTIRSDEASPGGVKSAVIGYRVWQNRFASDPTIVGKAIRVNGDPYTVVGVMPEGFLYPQNTQVWIPYQVDPLAGPRNRSPSLSVIGELKAGVTPAAAQQDLNVVAGRLAKEFKETNENLASLVMPFARFFIGPEPVRLLYTMLGAVGFVLLIACANVANLLLDRAAHKSKEVGIKTALGASRAAVIRQFLAEAMILSMLGAVLGTGIAYFGVDAFNRAIADTLPPFFIDIRLHPPVLLFIVGVMVLASLFAGLLPAIQSARADINEILKDESRGASSLHIGKMSKALVVFEVALSCGLLVAAGLMTKSVTKLRTMDPGFDQKNMFTARIGFPANYTDTIAQKLFFEQLVDKLAAIPGAQGAAVSTGLPGVNMGGRNIIPEGKTYDRPQDRPNVRTLGVTPGFFKTFGMPVRQGREFNTADRYESERVAIVNQKFAETHFKGQDPIGKRFRFPGGADSLRWLSIVGVVPNVYSGDNEEPWNPVVFTPFTQSFSNFASMSVRVTGAPMTITPQVRAAIASLNADLPIYWVYSMEEALARPTWFIRVFGTMFMIFGFIALFLAGIGLYAVMAFSVSRRTREVGIRMALGANSGNVVAMILRQGAVQMGTGLLLGIGLATAVSQLLSNILFDVQPRDPQVFGGVVGVLALAGFLACLIPARRATAVDPMVALRD
jgi:putative ABC transport system permease protein